MACIPLFNELFIIGCHQIRIIPVWTVEHQHHFIKNTSAMFDHFLPISLLSLSFDVFQELKQAESRLLDLYSTKFHTQNDFEYKLSKEVREHSYSPPRENLFFLLVLQRIRKTCIGLLHETNQLHKLYSQTVSDLFLL